MTTPKKPPQRDPQGEASKRPPAGTMDAQEELLDHIDSLGDEELAQYLADRGIDVDELDASAHSLAEEAVSSRRGYASHFDPRVMPSAGFGDGRDPPRVTRAAWMALAAFVTLVVGGVALLAAAFRPPHTEDAHAAGTPADPPLSTQGAHAPAAHP